MSHEHAPALEDVIEYGSKIARYTERMSLEEFRGNDLVFDAVVRNLELLGGAARRLPDDVTASNATWSRTAAFAEGIARQPLDRRIVWDLVQTKIPELVRSSTATLKRYKNVT